VRASTPMLLKTVQSRRIVFGDAAKTRALKVIIEA
jgi:hypothetical protein